VGADAVGESTEGVHTETCEIVMRVRERGWI
jgi:hypothetical protein